MQHIGCRFLVIAAVVGSAAVAAAQNGGASDPAPSLEYRPPRAVIPEPRAPTPAPPVTMFKEAIGNFGIGIGSFDSPVDVAVDADGNFYVLEAGNHRVQMFDHYSNVVRSFGSYGARKGEFSKPAAIAVDSTRSDFAYIFVVDTGNNRVQILQVERQTGKIEFFDTWGSLGSRDGDFKDPRDIVQDDEGNLWVLDVGNERIQKFKFDPESITSPKVTFLGNWGKLFGSRGGVFDNLVSIGWSKERLGYVYLLSTGCLVQQFQLDGTLVNSWPAVAPESGLCSPGRIEIDNENGYVHIIDSGNGLFERFTLDGRFIFAIRGAQRPFSKPRGLALNLDRDEVLIADTENNIVQKFTLR